MHSPETRRFFLVTVDSTTSLTEQRVKTALEFGLNCSFVHHRLHRVVEVSQRSASTGTEYLEPTHDAEGVFVG